MHILSFLLCITTSLFAQTTAVTGKVTDARDGSPLAGVSVQPKGVTSGGVVTGSDGRFTISVGQNVKTLVFTYVGFGTIEQSVTAEPIIVALNATGANLNEIVVIGYGRAKKSDLTGAIATVSEKDFQKGNITTPEQMIAGKLPGVSIISNGGQPGSGSTIRIRGGSSLNASNDPLIVINGVPIDNEIQPLQTSAVAGAGSPLSFINPNEIESFTVLKDASAAAIYGSRAANGVILITTKKGKSGPLKVNFNSTNSVSTIIKKASVLSPSQFRSVVESQGSASQIAALGSANTNWQDQIYSTGYGTTDNISINGGVKNLPYRISLGYGDQNGILKTDNLQRTSVGFAFNPVLLDNHLKIDLNLLATRESTRFANTAAIGAAIGFDPTQPVHTNSSRFLGYYEWLDPTSTTGLNTQAIKNPLGLLYNHFNTATPERSIGNLQVDYKFHFLPDLHANVNLGYDVAKGTGKVYILDSAAEEYVSGAHSGWNNPYKATKTNVISEFYLNYDKDLSRIKSHFNVLAGYSYNNYVNKVYNYYQFYTDGTEIDGTKPAYPVVPFEHVLISYFGRANYTFDDKYLLTATVRRDGSSRFAPANRWGTFPSVAFAWKINQESFLKNSNVLSDLKLRLGYGVTGQQDGIGDYLYYTTYYQSQGSASYQFGNNFYPGYRPTGYDPNIKWEQTTTYNAGFDYGFFNNRITGTIDVYEKKTNHLLNTLALAAGSNFAAYFTENVGDMTNKGIEFNVNATVVQTKDWSWDVGFNVTYNKNKITRLTVNPGDTSYPGFASGAIAGGIGGQYAEINSVGYSKNTFYLYHQKYNAEGKPIDGSVADKNGDGVINQNDRYRTKPADPQTYLGFSTNVNYKKWSLGTVLRSSLGMYAYNNTWSQTGNKAQILNNVTLSNASTNYLTTGFSGSNSSIELLSDYYIHNASFVRMDNLTLGYNVGKLPHMDARLRLNASVQNVFVITGYKGLDPEISAGNTTPGNPGIDNNVYPRPRTYNLGLNLDF